MIKLFLTLPVIFLIAAGCNNVAPIGQSDNQIKACSQEAMQCPDGSYVSRTGPNCEFAVCPTQNTSSGTPASTSSSTPPSPKPTPSKKGIVKGQVLLGPTCPVERIPPDPACAPKPYQTIIRIQPINQSAPYMTVSTDNSGIYSVSLDPGSYTFQPQGGSLSYPTCRSTEVGIISGQTQTVNLDCDTGIR